MNRDFVQENAQSRARLKALITRLSPGQLAMPLDDGWTISAVLAHIAFWDRRMLLLIERFQRDGVTDSPYDVHVMNDAMKPMLLAIPPNEAARICIVAAEQVDMTVAALSDALIQVVKDHGTPFNPYRSEHRSYHLDDIERALALA